MWIFYTPTHTIPLMVSGQSGKDITHNEAVLLIDLLLHPFVKSRAVSSPPEQRVSGDMWIVPSGSTGEWEEHERFLAAWTAGGWRFIPPKRGMRVYIADEGIDVRYIEDQWVLV